MLKRVGQFFLVSFVIAAVTFLVCRWYFAPVAFFTPGPQCADNIIREINRAHTIDIAVYAITAPDIADAIVAAHGRGVRVRIVSDRTMAAHHASQIPRLRDAGIAVATNTQYKIEHNKFAVFDNRRVVTGSFNWTTNASDSNSENCVFFIQTHGEFNARFEYLWGVYLRGRRTRGATDSKLAVIRG